MCSMQRPCNQLGKGPGRKLVSRPCVRTRRPRVLQLPQHCAHARVCPRSTWCCSRSSWTTMPRRSPRDTRARYRSWSRSRAGKPRRRAQLECRLHGNGPGIPCCMTQNRVPTRARSTRRSPLGSCVRCTSLHRSTTGTRPRHGPVGFAQHANGTAYLRRTSRCTRSTRPTARRHSAPGSRRCCTTALAGDTGTRCRHVAPVL